MMIIVYEDVYFVSFKCHAPSFLPIGSDNSHVKNYQTIPLILLFYFLLMIVKICTHSYSSISGGLF